MKGSIINISLKLVRLQLFSWALWSGTATAATLKEHYHLDLQRDIYGAGLFQDQINIPQGEEAIVDVASNDQLDSFSEYFRLYFRPWSTDVKFDKASISKLFTKMPTRYLENYEQMSSDFFNEMANNANISATASVNRKAIVVRNTSLRIYPTDSLLFANPAKTGEGYPFDYAQDDFIRIAEPVLISHFTKDGLFAYVYTSSGTYGFINSNDIEFISKQDEAVFTSNLVMVLGDTNGGLKDSSRSVRLLMATVLPLKENTSDTVLLPVQTKSGIETMDVSLTEDILTSIPLAFSRDNVKRIVNSLINKPYGWGGNLFHRDCARLTRDYFAAFGIHLPLVSRDQAKVGNIHDISNLNKDEKSSAIAKKAIPYQSIVYLPGHPAVYMGQFNGEPIMLHSLWGLGLSDDLGNDYRFIVGRSLISSLSPGKELLGMQDRRMLISRITSISNFIRE